MQCETTTTTTHLIRSTESNMADGKILLEVKSNVKFKKNDGKLHLLTNKLVWIQTDVNSSKFECQYSEIKGKIGRFYVSCCARNF